MRSLPLHSCLYLCIRCPRIFFVPCDDSTNRLNPHPVGVYHKMANAPCFFLIDRCFVCHVQTVPKFRNKPSLGKGWTYHRNSPKVYSEHNRTTSPARDWTTCALHVSDVTNTCRHPRMFIVVCDWTDDVLGGVHPGTSEKNVRFYDNFFNDFGMSSLFFLLLFNVWSNLCFTWVNVFG